MIDEASLLPPADHGIRGTAAVDGRLAVDREDSASVDGRQLLSQQRRLHGELVVIPRETGHLTGSDVSN